MARAQTVSAQTLGKHRCPGELTVQCMLGKQVTLRASLPGELTGPKHALATPGSEWLEFTADRKPGTAGGRAEMG